MSTYMYTNSNHIQVSLTLTFVSTNAQKIKTSNRGPLVWLEYVPIHFLGQFFKNIFYIP